LEHLLLQPAYGGFLTASLALSDAYERGLLADLAPFTAWSEQIAAGIAGKEVVVMDLDHPSLPKVLQRAFGALQVGQVAAVAKEEKGERSAVTAARGPQRIVSLGPINTENIYLLGAQDRLMANTSYCMRPAAAREKPKVGSVMEISVEKIISFRPDLVLATNLSPSGPLAKLSQLGIPVVSPPLADSFAAVCRQFEDLGRLLGLEERAQAVTREARARVAAISQAVAGRPRPKVFLQLAQCLSAAR
jgi:ABC-type Fe3+-hydroxamate transport system substrate-binding protein